MTAINEGYISERRNPWWLYDDGKTGATCYLEVSIYRRPLVLMKADIDRNRLMTGYLLLSSFSMTNIHTIISD